MSDSKYKCATPVDANTQDSISPADALEILKAGNARFVKSKTDKNALCEGRDLNDYLKVTGGGQWPFASVLCCIDSRVPAETIFDQYIGDIFVARVAGNFVNTDILGSLEYATLVAKSKLVVILGHTGCGAVKSAIGRVKVTDSNINPMLDNILPAVEAVENTDFITGDKHDEAFTDRVIKANVFMNISRLRNESPIMNDLAAKGEINIVGAVYNVSTGEVEFM